MSKLPIIGIFVLMLLVISGYVSSNEETQAIPTAATGQHLDPHLNYYEQHLIAMGVVQPGR